MIFDEPISRFNRQIIKADWAPPNLGWAKINVDASYCKDRLYNHLGFVIRDDLNFFVAARVSSCRFTSSEEGEARAVRDGILWARERGFPRVMVETDAEAITSFCQTGAASISWTAKAISQDALASCSYFDDICINYAPRSANHVAHYIASRPTGDNVCFSWTGSPPECCGLSQGESARISAAVVDEEASGVTETEPIEVVEEKEEVAAEETAVAETEAPTTTKLYFGNLPYNCDSSSLAGIIQDYGSPEMVEERNFGEVLCLEEFTEKAIRLSQKIPGILSHKSNVLSCCLSDIKASVLLSLTNVVPLSEVIFVCPVFSGAPPEISVE
ncbi:hypothetical protein GIB67_009079 [Kingdonia uniflora]|uniref:RNase H type-1 domain-containing protein n=1 Tax=Kingdonia uniflora TaxID=39325 RepID=A0A7J7MNH2_9MAGN|nr:hypothetical protein GIB67_009079 [Kingdonia uniflora]